MEKAFDVKDLIARGKAEVGPDFEKVLKKCWGVVKAWVKDSAALLTSPLVKMIVPVVVESVDSVVMAELDKVDGQIGN